MRAKAKMITYTAVAAIAYLMGRCTYRMEMRTEQVLNPVPETQVYSITGELIEHDEPVYCIDQEMFDSIENIEAFLK